MKNIGDNKLTEQEILKTLDNSHDGFYCTFVELDFGYSYLIDTRLNVFRGKKDHWAIAVERLGYNPRADAIILDIFYFGNCLINLESYNNRPSNYYSVYPIDNNNFNETIVIESLKTDAKFWLVRGQKVSLSHNKQDYFDAEIELKEYEPNEISVEEAGRLVVIENRDLFRATDNEIYKSIPKDLDKILVLNEWYHKDFSLQISPAMTEEHLKQTYEFNKNLTGLNDMSFKEFVISHRKQSIMNDDWNREMWDNNRPSTYETWQQIAEVIITNNPELYKPTLKPNTHWKYWLNSGSL
ncbi:MAG: hypothetical protein K8R54_10005 [Bacteroidales bacterium]|nr:hypothetical protein [Bacteroidales bacterium]